MGKDKTDAPDGKQGGDPAATPSRKASMKRKASKRTSRRKKEAVVDVWPVAVGPRGRWTLMKLLGKGSFGSVFSAEDKKTGQMVAVKFEHRTRRKRPVLEYEAGLYKDIGNAAGFSHFFWFGNNKTYDILVFSLVGPDLKKTFAECGEDFSLETIVLIAIQVLNHLRTLHDKGYLHRDLKPANLSRGYPGSKNEQDIYMLDLGLALSYIDPETGKHRNNEAPPVGVPRRLKGTPKYASVRNHEGKMLSRRDDLESFGYILLHWLRGDLPWDGLSNPKAKERIKKFAPLGDLKREMSSAELFDGFPEQFEEYMHYCRSLRFKEKPDYRYLIGLFKQLYLELADDRRMRFVYDWNAEGESSSEDDDTEDTEDTTDASPSDVSPSSEDPTTTTGDTNIGGTTAMSTPAPTTDDDGSGPSKS